MTQASRDLEALVAKIQRQLAPNAEVLHNVYLDGRSSGIKRQIDVLIRDRIGQFEMNIVIDCKDHRRPVDVTGIEAFDGLVRDVGAHRGVLVSPNGFTETAKTRAKGLQIDIYSPVDTDAHKWQAIVTLPAVVDFRSAKISFGIGMSAPLPFRLKPTFISENMVYDASEKKLGTMLTTAIEKWNEGRFPIEPGVHDKQPIFDAAITKMDNGEDPPLNILVPVYLYAGLWVERQLLLWSTSHRADFRIL